jgi:hypothetical protein
LIFGRLTNAGPWGIQGAPIVLGRGIVSIMLDMKADPRTEAAVMHVLSRVVEFASSGDVDGAIALFADDPDVFLLGTGVDEARTGHAAIREQITRDLSQADALSWILSPQSISAAGSVAWTSGDVVVRVSMGGQTMDIPHRLTTVLERREGTWRLQQMHLSFANGAQVVGQSFPTNLEAVADAVGRERVDLQARVAPDGTVTLLFTDIEGSTPMAERLGDLSWLALLREHNAIVRAQIAQHGGFEVKTIGDAFMVAFGSARRALMCAIGIQQGISRYGADHPEQAMRCARETTSTAEASSSPRGSRGKRPAGRSSRRRCCAN